MVSGNGCVQFLLMNQHHQFQIQEFLDVNRARNQHIALQTSILCKRSHNSTFVVYPSKYPPYTQLQQQGLLSVAELEIIATNLVDWKTTPALLLQTTQPILTNQLFFFELIERRSQARGFGRGNAPSLIEAEQVKRGSCYNRSTSFNKNCNTARAKHKSLTFATQCED